MLMELYLFELRFHRRQLVFKAAALAFLLMGFAFSQGRFGQFGVLNNSPFTTAMFTALLSLGSVLAVGLFAGGAVLRDREFGMEPIIHATNLTQAQYVLSRFAGLLSAALLAFAPALLGMFLGSVFPLVPAERFGAPNPVPLIWNLVIVAVPNILLGVAVIFATAALTKNLAATYLSGVMLYLLYWLGSMVGNSPIMAQSNPVGSDQQALAALLDPYGLVAVLEHTRYWTVADKNSQLIPLSGSLLMNRLTWTAFSLGLFALTYRLISFRIPSAKKVRPVQTQTIAEPVAYRPLKPDARILGRNLAALSSLTRVQLRMMMRGIPFMAMMLSWLFFVTVNMTEGLRGGDLGMSLQPDTTLLVPIIVEALRAFGALMVIFFSAELVWLDRDRGMAPLVDSAPVGNGVFLAGQCVTLATLPMIFALLAVVSGLMVQVVLGGSVSADWLVYLDLFPAAVLPLLIIGVTSLLIQHITPNKYVGMGAAFLVIFLNSNVILPRALFFEHPMLQFVFMPKLLYSNMANTAYHAEAMWLHLIFWMGFALIIAALLPRFQRRGARRGGMPQHMMARALGVAGLLIFTLSGGLLFYQINVDAAYQSKDDALAHRTAYERAYGEQAEAPQPTITSAKVDLELFPAQRAFELKGALNFENQTELPLEEVLIALDSRIAEDYQVEVENASLISRDKRFNQLRFRFDQPLGPAASGLLTFQLRAARGPFRKLDAEAYVLPKASYVELEKWMPMFGMNDRLLITGPRRRAEQGLPPRLELPPAGETPVIARNHVNMALTVTTDANETVIASLPLTGTQSQNDRQTWTFQSGGRIPYYLAVATGDYVTQTVDARGVQVTTYTHPGHEGQVPSLLAGAVASLDYFRENFGPFPHPGVSIVEIPAFSDKFGGTSYPGVIYAVENRLYQLKPHPSGYDHAYRGMAHEVSHMYWGQQLNPALTEGARFLTETLAEYSEMAVYRASDLPGKDIFLNEARGLYFYLRGFDDAAECPLVQTQNQPYIHYFKGAHVVHVLYQLLGEQTVNAVLRDMLVSFPYPHKPHAEDLAKRLLAQASPEDQPMIRELLYEVVTYDVSLVSAKVSSTSDGLDEVTLAVTGHMTRVTEDGAVEKPLDRMVEVGFNRDGEQVDLQRVHISPERPELKFQVLAGVDEVVLDPHTLLLEAVTVDNRLKLRTPQP